MKMSKKQVPQPPQTTGTLVVRVYEAINAVMESRKGINLALASQLDAALKQIESQVQAKDARIAELEKQVAAFTELPVEDAEAID